MLRAWQKWLCSSSGSKLVTWDVQACLVRGWRGSALGLHPQWRWWGWGGDGVLKRFNCGENELNWYPDSTLKNPSDFGGLNL